MVMANFNHDGFFFFHRNSWLFILGTVTVLLISTDTDYLHTVSKIERELEPLFIIQCKAFQLKKYTDISTRFNYLFVIDYLHTNLNVKYTHDQAIFYSQTCNFSSSLASLFHRLIGCPEIKSISFGTLLCKPNRIK